MPEATREQIVAEIREHQNHASDIAAKYETSYKVVLQRRRLTCQQRDTRRPCFYCTKVQYPQIPPPAPGAGSAFSNQRFPVDPRLSAGRRAQTARSG